MKVKINDIIRKYNNMSKLVEESSILEQLEEQGKINLDYLDLDIELLIFTLDLDYNIHCEIKEMIGNYYLINNNYKEGLEWI